MSEVMVKIPARELLELKRIERLFYSQLSTCLFRMTKEELDTTNDYLIKMKNKYEEIQQSDKQTDEE